MSSLVPRWEKEYWTEATQDIMDQLHTKTRAKSAAHQLDSLL
jgi:hypothetical protein